MGEWDAMANQAHGGFDALETTKAGGKATSGGGPHGSGDIWSRLRTLQARFAAVQETKRALAKRLEKIVGADRISKDRLSQVERAKESARFTYELAHAHEQNLAAMRNEISKQKHQISARRQHLLGQMEKLLTLKKNLDGEFRNLYGPTLDKLKVAQQNLTYRRWDLAQGLAYIYALQGFSGIGSPMSSPDRLPGQRQLRSVSICGLELDSNAIKRGKDVASEKDSELASRVKLATVFGYVAHVLLLLSSYFDIPLRYPIKAIASRSCICDMMPSQKTGSNQNAPGMETVNFPLYIDHAGVERERTRFAYAVFLLNKNIEQILHAHGLDACGSGPHYTLPNLHKFLSYS